MNDITINLKACEEKYAQVRAKLTEVQTAITENRQSDAKRGLEVLKGLVEEYNILWKKTQFDALLAQEQPMLSAIKRLNILHLSVSAKTNDDGDLIGCDVKQPKKASIKDNIDLTELEDHADTRISANGQWRYWVENFTVIMAARTCEAIGKKTAAERYRARVKMTPEARASGRVADGNANTLAVLQEIVDAILFLDSGKAGKDGKPLNKIKMTTQDVAYITSVMCKETAGIAVSLPNAKTMRRLITKALHRNLTGKEYEFLYEAIAEDEPEEDLPEVPGASKSEVRRMIAE